MENFILSTFIISLLICVILGKSIIWALLLGYILFSYYAYKVGFKRKEIFKMQKKGIKKTKTVAMTLAIIGILTGVWRVSGTIAFIIYYASKLVRPEIFILMTFILCCGVSFLMGTAFGTAATIGTICMTMANSMGIDSVWTGGAILSGVYFGDRCSPMSTSAILVSEITNTNIFENIKLMIKTAKVPFLLTCIVYTIAGFTMDFSNNIIDFNKVFEMNFTLKIIEILPAILVLILSLFKIEVRKIMLLSIVSASLIAVFVEKVGITELLNVMIFGYNTKNIEISILKGGGIISMAKVVTIVVISSSYAGIFEKTELLTKIKTKVKKLAYIINEIGATFIVSIFTSIIACNQTLAIVMTEELINKIVKKDKKRAIYLENTVVLIAGLIPWSIACNVPLALVGADYRSIALAVYIYILPIYSLFL